MDLIFCAEAEVQNVRFALENPWCPVRMIWQYAFQALPQNGTRSAMAA